MSPVNDGATESVAAAALVGFWAVAVAVSALGVDPTAHSLAADGAAMALPATAITHSFVHVSAAHLTVNAAVGLSAARWSRRRGRSTVVAGGALAGGVTGAVAFVVARSGQPDRLAGSSAALAGMAVVTAAVAWVDRDRWWRWWVLLAAGFAVPLGAPATVLAHVGGMAGGIVWLIWHRARRPATSRRRQRVGR